MSAGADYETIVIGAGQAGLAAGYYLSRAGLRFTLLDASRQHEQVHRNEPPELAHDESVGRSAAGCLDGRCASG